MYSSLLNPYGERIEAPLAFLLVPLAAADKEEEEEEKKERKKKKKGKKKVAYMGAVDTVKICVVGPKGCGKSALVKLLVEGEDIRKTSAPTVAVR